MNRGGPIGHGFAVVVYAGLAVALTWPLIGHLGDAVIGYGPGDNLTFVWNFWWARVALDQPDRTLYWTADLFAPLGTSLVLHALTPVLSVGAAVLREPDPIRAYNVAILLSVFLNGICTYAAAYLLTRDKVAAGLGGAVFAAAPFLLVRLQGHLNVLSAWVFPLLLIALVHLERRRTIGSALQVSAVLALLVYTDYYYAVFGLVVVALCLASWTWTIQPASRPMTAVRRRAVRTLSFVLAALVVLILWIALTGGADTTLAGRSISVRSTFNPRVAAWWLFAAILVIWKWPLLVVDRRAHLVGRVFAQGVGRVSAAGVGRVFATSVGRVFETRQGAGSTRIRPLWRLLVPMGAATAILILPVLAAAFELWRAGDYVTQRFSWRSAPGGLDLATLLTGNPMSRLTGGLADGLFQRFGLDRIESVGWLGLAPMVLIAATFGRLRQDAGARLLLFVAAVFFVWSLGPYLMVLGYNTGLMLPQGFFKFVPLLSNARIPGRAFVVVVFATALLAAYALALLRQSGRGVSLTIAVVGLFVLDAWPRPQPLIAIDRPALYRTLEKLPSGVVLEVPAGLRDGFGMRGNLNHRALLYQSVHGHPLMGGFVARLSPRVLAAFDNDPVIRRVLDLSEGRASAPDAALGPCDGTLACAVRYVVVDESRASAELRAFVGSAFVMRPIERNEDRELFAVTGLRDCPCK